MNLHVGRGATAGALTVFPVWRSDGGRRKYVTDVGQVDISENEGGAVVPTLTATNLGPKPVLVLEGHLFEGGWQHRMAVASSMLEPARRTQLEVACVEHGRWGGGSRQEGRGRRATPFVRAGSHATPADTDRQSEVWRRVGTYVGAHDDTGSLVTRLDLAEAEVDRLVEDLRPLAGQVGVVVAIGGQPLMAEIFDDPRTLAEQFASIVRAAGLDALGQPELRTPSRRAWRMVDRLELLRPAPAGTGGLAMRTAARSEHLDVTGLVWEGRDVHLRATNLRHPILVGAR